MSRITLPATSVSRVAAAKTFAKYELGMIDT